MAAPSFRSSTPPEAYGTPIFHMRMETFTEVTRKAGPGGPDILLLQEVGRTRMPAMSSSPRELSGLGYPSSVLMPKKKLSANVAIASPFPISRVRSNAVHAWPNNPVRDVI